MKNTIHKITLLILISFSACHNPPVPGCEGKIVFTSNGDSFEPRITVDQTQQPVILWTWADGTNDGSAAPFKDYGSPAERRNILHVRPWSSVVGINLGYDGDDGGDAFGPLEHHAPQAVVDVTGLEVVASSLRFWCSSGTENHIPSLDFSNFTALERIECFSAVIPEINLVNTDSLRRLCLEGAGVQNILDLTGCPNMEDLRAASNLVTGINFGAPTYPNLWHLCMNTNSNLIDVNMFENITKFPSLSELLINATGQQGTFNMTFSPDQDMYITGAVNQYETVHLSGALQYENRVAVLDFSNNLISEINIDGCDQISILYLQNNQLDVDAVDYILITLDALGRTFIGIDLIVDLTGNTASSAAGQAAAANLDGKGWVVNTD